MHSIIGQSQHFRATLHKASLAAKSRVRILLKGETGTGKETLARFIHAESAQNAHPFVAVNCASLSPDLLESELFGHVKGAFTGALKDHGGLVAAAAGGTLFLDEIAEMPPALQAKLLRFAETGEFRKVGSAAIEKADMRLIAATHRNLDDAVRRGLFREDLYYRLAIVTLTLPPLRERRDDIPLLAAAFLDGISAAERRAFTHIEPASLAALASHPWPGNIRELYNMSYNAAVMQSGPALSLALPHPESSAVMELMRGSTKPQPLWRVEQAAIDAAVDYCGGNIPQAARLLEVSPSTLYRRRETA